MAVKQEDLVYWASLIHDSFIVQSIPRWLDYREQERGEERGRARYKQKKKDKGNKKDQQREKEAGVS